MLFKPLEKAIKKENPLKIQQGFLDAIYYMTKFFMLIQSTFIFEP